MQKRLPMPKTVTENEIRAVFEKHGFKTVSEKAISIDAYEMFKPLLTMVQWAQWWGELLSANGRSTQLRMEGKEFLGLSIHSASAGQQVGIVRANDLDSVLNMLKSWIGGLRAYGRDAVLRGERLLDNENTQVHNDLLDALAPCMLELLALALPPEAKEAPPAP